MLAFAIVLAAQSPVPQAEDAQAGKKVCRTEEVTGSRLGGKRQCRTAAEWRAIDEATARDVRDNSRGSNFNRANNNR